MSTAAVVAQPAEAHRRIGPNAITRVAEALPGMAGPLMTTQVFARAGLLRYLGAPPEAMVDEAEVAGLHRALHDELGAALARRVARSAGRRTAEYLLAHRIPRPFQALLDRLPAPLAARLLVAAIRRHAWTFTGSGEFSARFSTRLSDRFTSRPTDRSGVELQLVIHDNPLCRDRVRSEPACDYFAATFQRLFARLVHRQAWVREVACEAQGAEACVFEVGWRAPHLSAP